MLKITGYSDQISVAPGDSIKFMVNCEHPEYQAKIVRVVSGDLNPEGPGVIEEIIDTPANGTYPGRKQEIYAGSYAMVPSSAPLESLGSFSVQVMVWPTTPRKGLQALVSKWSTADNSGFALVIDESGGAAFMVGDGNGGVASVSVGKPMVEYEWYLAAATYDADTGAVTVRQEPQVEFPTIDDAGTAEQTVSVAPAANKAPLMMAACYGGDTPRGDAAIGKHHFNGKLDSPSIVSGVLSAGESAQILVGNAPTTLAQRVVGNWDFSLDITETTITDASSHRLHGKIVHLPTRGVTGYNWTGEEMRWKHAPEQYGAIKFHDDDVYDSGWDADFELTIPDSMKSGIYAAHLLAGENRDDEEYIPFVVRPAPGKENKICFLFPITSYKAYANEHFATDPWPAEIMTHRAVELDKHHIFLNEHREYGHSLYDRHSDGTGVHISSRLRPVLNMRPKAQTMLGGDGSAALAVQRRHAPHRVAREDGLRVRRDYRRGRSLWRDRRPRALQRRADRLAPGILFQEHVRCRLRLHPSGRAAHVHGRQRLLLARVLPSERAGSDRAAAFRRRKPGVGAQERRVLYRLHLRI